MNCLLVKINPRSPFHLGEQGIGLEETCNFVHSDTLFGALCWNWSLLFGKGRLEDDLIKPFINGEPPFIFTSAFPFANEVLFLPRPQIELKVKNEEDKEFKANLRKVDFVSYRLLMRLLSGECLAQDGVEFRNDKQVLIEVEECDLVPEMIWGIGQIPRVTLDRITSASEIYHVGLVTFAEGCGLWFAVCFFEGSLKEDFYAATRLMGDEGLGGDRTAGSGLFEPSFETVDLPDLSNSRYVFLLSLYNPEHLKELVAWDLNNSHYTLIKRRGWVFSVSSRNLKQKAATFFGEGSVLKRRELEKPQEPFGRLVKVLDGKDKGGPSPHPVYRNGLAFTIGLGGDK